MTTLTAAQLARLKDLTGNTSPDQPDQLSEAELQAEYDEAEADFDTTVVYVLRRRLGLAAKWSDRSGETNSDTRSQRWEHLKALLAYWEERTGLKGATMKVGALNLGLDEIEA